MNMTRWLAVKVLVMFYSTSSFAHHSQGSMSESLHAHQHFMWWVFALILLGVCSVYVFSVSKNKKH